MARDANRRAQRREELGLPDPMVDAIGGEFNTTPTPVNPSGVKIAPPKTTSGPVNTTQPIDPDGVPDSKPVEVGATGGTGKSRSYDYIPGAEDVQYGDTSRMSGFNTNEWGPGQDTEGYDEFSYKNTFGKIASNYPPTPESVRQLVNDPVFKAQFPNAVLVDHPTDPKIQFESGDPPVDVLIASGQGGWGWQPGGEGGGGGGGGGGATGAGGGTFPGSIVPTNIDALGESDILAQIQAALAAYGRGEQPFLDKAINQEFG